MDLRAVTTADRRAIRCAIDERWGLPVVSISGAYDPSTLEGFVAEEEGELVGLVTYRSEASGIEVVTLDAWRPRCGVGTALLLAVKAIADARGVRLWLITTNDNVEALGFYQRRGMDVVALHRDFADVVRAKKPALRELASAPIPFRHAFELTF